MPCAQEKLSPMQKLCFIRAMRMDNLKSAIISFIAHFIGQKFENLVSDGPADPLANSTQNDGAFQPVNNRSAGPLGGPLRFMIYKD